ncbi:unnamed protein product [Symbiodinium natans]|uniref:Transmembrane protein n=1 Tax=Symbiodinium natans TaxID=878477 RepID=A0A812TMB5_9DINO|nr:unnamed protein product [Symbiodinium natans]
MAIIVGDSNGLTRFSSLEYQAIMFVLAILMSVSWALVEIVMKRFALLPVLFPGVFAIREKRLYFFDIEVNEVSDGKALRWEAMMITRLTVIVVLSYLWESCVFQTTTHVGKDFPLEECRRGMDCFASELRIQTFISRNHQPVNCSSAHESGEFFDKQVVVSCVMFVTPSLTQWLMHLAIAHSQIQMTLKAFGVLVWSCGQYAWFHRVILATSVISAFIVCGLTFGGVMTNFNSSWSGFVISFSFPVFFWIVWNCGRILQHLWMQDSKRMQESIEENLSLALKDLARRAGAVESGEPDMGHRESITRKKGYFSSMKQTFSKLPSILKNRGSSMSGSQVGGAEAGSFGPIKSSDAAR